MEAEAVEIPCPSCKAKESVPADATERRCRSCNAHYRFLRCWRCHETAQVSGNISRGDHWVCPGCRIKVDVPFFRKPAFSSASTLHDLLESKGLLGDDPDVRTFGGFRVTRRSGFDLPKRALCSVNCTPVDVRIVVVGGRQIASIPYEELTDVDITMASALNALLTTTVMRIASRKGEVFLHNGAMTPDAMRSAFSPLFTRMEAAKVEASTAPVRDDDPAVQLERLTRLRDSGALTEEEFQAARAPLVQRLLDSR